MTTRRRARRRTEPEWDRCRFRHFELFHNGLERSELFDRDGTKLALIRHSMYLRKHRMPSCWRCCPTGAGRARELPTEPLAEIWRLPIRSLPHRERAILGWLDPWLRREQEHR